ncbi:MAG: SDR family NAD(P)-dependent oxidoreductase [Pseudomonadales bacterium]
MRIDLSDKTVLVTGAARGIGRAMAAAFAEAGARVAVNDLEAPAEFELPFFRADVSRKAEVDDMFAAIGHELGPVDILVNNAGITLVRPFLELSEHDWDRVLATNLKSMFLCCQAALPGMLAQGAGVIVNIASELGYLGRARFAPYAAAKGGVLSLTRSLAREFAPTVRVNAIAPGPVDTDMLRSEIQRPEELAAEMAIPMGRLGSAGEIAATAVFLASPAASFFCGDVLSPSGGALMR